MAFTCGFFNSENGDRKYNAEQMSAIFDGIIADGVFTTIGDHMAVSAGTGMQVLVGTGKAWFDHTWNVNDAAYPLAIAASDVTLSRIDAIVLETNHSDSVRLNKLRVVQGTVASSPAKPTLTNSEKVHQHPLAWVTVAPGVTQIAASAIENAVGTSACPFVTGIIATTAIDDLFNQWNGEFDEWFDNLKAQLSDNVVANLQNQIDARVKIADKATADDVYNGTDDSKWVSPASLSGSVLKIGDIQASGRNLETETNGKLLQCDGRLLSKTAYPDLFNAIGNKWGESGRNFKRYVGSNTSGGSGRGFEYCLAHAIDDNGDILSVQWYYNGPIVALWTDKNGTAKKYRVILNTTSDIYHCACRFINHKPFIVLGYEEGYYILNGSSATTSSGYVYVRTGDRIQALMLSETDGNDIYILCRTNYSVTLDKFTLTTNTTTSISITNNTGGSELSTRWETGNVVCLDYEAYVIWKQSMTSLSAVLNMKTGRLTTIPNSNPVHQALHNLTERSDHNCVMRDAHALYFSDPNKNCGYFIERINGNITAKTTEFINVNNNIPQFVGPKKIMANKTIDKSGNITFQCLDIEANILTESTYQLASWQSTHHIATRLYSQYTSFGVTESLFVPGYTNPSSGRSQLINQYGVSDGTFPIPKDAALEAGNCLYIKAIK